MKIVKKILIQPTKQQKDTFLFWIRRCKTLYNTALEEKIEIYRKTKKTISVYDQKKEIPSIKELDKSWKDVPNKCLSNTLFQLDTAFQNFFKKGNVGFPKFKNIDTFKSIEFTSADVRIKNGEVFLPKIKNPIRCTEETPNTYSGVRLKKEGNHFFLCFITEIEEKPLRQPSDNILALDLGLKSLWVTDTGEVQNRFSLKLINKYTTRIANLNKSLSKKKKGSSRHKKVKKHLSKAHERLRNSRKDFIHKATTKLVKESNASTIVCGDLKLNELKQKEKTKVEFKKKENVSKCSMRRAYSQSSIGFVKSFLLYKCKKEGKYFALVNEAYTSKTCSRCGYVHVGLKLSDRTFRCGNCKQCIDRDRNGAINIKNVWLGQFNPIGEINLGLLRQTG